MRLLTKTPSRSPRWLRSLSLFVLAAAVIVWGGVIVQFWGLNQGDASPATAALVTTTLPTPALPTPAPSALPQLSPQTAPQTSPEVSPQRSPSLPSPATLPPSTPIPSPKVQTKYGHFPYAEVAHQRLVSIGRYYDRPEALAQEAAAAFKQMVKAARAVQVQIIPISGFRTIGEQVGLFERQIQRQGSPQAAAFLSAPAGYSEHHTGYAIDLGDGTAPNHDLRYSFEQTAAYKWLQQNASTYGFELSFPDKNPQGISFEPWHWRYVGSTEAQAVFVAARANRN